VAMLDKDEAFGPITGIRELVMRVARIHPGFAVARIVVGKGKMRRSVAKRLADGDAFGIERIRDAADRRLGPLLVDVPLVELFDRTGVHGDQWRMDDRTGIHQRARERIAAWLDGIRKRAFDHAERVWGQAQWKH